MEKRSIRLQEIMAAVFSVFFHSVSFRRWLLWPSSFFSSRRALGQAIVFSAGLVPVIFLLFSL